MQHPLTNIYYGNSSLFSSSFCPSDPPHPSCFATPFMYILFWFLLFLSIFLLTFSDFLNFDFLFQTNLNQTILSILLKQMEIIPQLLHSLGTTVCEIWIVCLCRHVLFRIFRRSCIQSFSVPFVVDDSFLRKCMSFSMCFLQNLESCILLAILNIFFNFKQFLNSYYSEIIC